MDKKTIIAVSLSVVIIIGSMIVQSIFFPTPPPSQATTVVKEESPAAQAPGGAAAPLASAQVLPVEEENLQEQTVALENEVFRVTFTNRGGMVQSILLKEFKNADGSPVEMIIRGDSTQLPFSIHFGGPEAKAVDSLFAVERYPSESRVDFTRSFFSQSGVPFTLRKSYLFKPGDYLMELRVTIENSVNDFPALNVNGTAYTLGFGPQIGPAFKKLDKRYEYRNFVTYAYAERKRKDVKIPKEGVVFLEKPVNWAAIVGKYFAVIALPYSPPKAISYDTRPIAGIAERSSLYFSRPEILSSKNTDVFHFYMGPKKREVLLRYNSADKNSFKLSDAHFEEIVQSSPLLGWLADILKFCLEMFYKVIPNYGVAIILLTFFIKILLIPLTQKSFESTARMQTLSPKMNEIREKYKNNPQKMNQEIAVLYKKEGINPLGGCLPLLLQMPIFFALYNLLSTHFELRGASFLPPWIKDLSAPESVWNFAPISIPILGWEDLRVLPFLMLITTFIQSRISQGPDSSTSQMKMMTYMMPIVFFFILYDMPSGLVLYWAVQNFLSIFHQLYLNRKRRLMSTA